jgi:hypothetical protein
MGSIGALQRRGTAALLSIFAVLALGCATPPFADLAFVTSRADVLKPALLQRDVEGEYCFAQDVISTSLRPPWRARLADHARAVALAIETVPGANILTNVSVDVRVEQYLLFQRICAVVTGDAGRVE